MTLVTQDNIEAKIVGTKLVITIDVSKQIVDKAPMSGSGKNRVLASTRGFLTVNGGPPYLAEVRIGLNVIMK